MGRINPYIYIYSFIYYGKIKHVPNHQPDMYIYIYLIYTIVIRVTCPQDVPVMEKNFVFTAFTRDFRHFQHLGFRCTSSKTREAEPGDRTFRMSGGLDPLDPRKQCHSCEKNNAIDVMLTIPQSSPSHHHFDRC